MTFEFTVVNCFDVSAIGGFVHQESSRGPVWPLILAIIAIYVLAALIDPCDGGCTYDDVTHDQQPAGGIR